jgi:hypothetical protein
MPVDVLAVYTGETRDHSDPEITYGPDERP